jgi:hypothetical protein
MAFAIALVNAPAIAITSTLSSASNHRFSASV